MNLQNGCGKKFNLKAVDKMGVEPIIYFLETYSDCVNACIDCTECPLNGRECLKLQGRIINRSIELLKELNDGENVE